jgi:hypothetical protein
MVLVKDECVGWVSDKLDPVEEQCKDNGLVPQLQAGQLEHDGWQDQFL